jgi:hypothetical protein
MRTADRKLTFGSNTAENEARLRELILYVVQQCESDDLFGATKLNKILYYTDFYSFGRTGEPVTGVQYMRLQNGPAPKRLVPVRDEMVRSGDLEVWEEQTLAGYKRTRFHAKREADVTIFSAPQLKLVHEVMKHLENQTAREVSLGSHGRAWHMVEDGELIPYEAVFISERGLIDADIAVIRALGQRYNWRDRVKKTRGSLKESRKELR